MAKWPAVHSGSIGCDQVAIVTIPLTASTTNRRSFWVVLSGEVNWGDVGFCAPDLDLSGKTWMGYQDGKVAVYRASGKVAAGNLKPPDQGTDYGQRFGAGANITVIAHGGSSLEFLLDGVSQGHVKGVTIPSDWGGCIGACGTTTATLDVGGSAPSISPAGSVKVFSAFQDNVEIEVA